MVFKQDQQDFFQKKKLTNSAVAQSIHQGHPEKKTQGPIQGHAAGWGMFFQPGYLEQGIQFCFFLS